MRDYYERKPYRVISKCKKKNNNLGKAVVPTEEDKTLGWKKPMAKQQLPNVLESKKNCLKKASKK